MAKGSSAITGRTFRPWVAAMITYLCQKIQINLENCIRPPVPFENFERVCVECIEKNEINHGIAMLACQRISGANRLISVHRNSRITHSSRISEMAPKRRKVAAHAGTDKQVLVPIGEGTEEMEVGAGGQESIHAAIAQNQYRTRQRICHVNNLRSVLFCSWVQMPRPCLPPILLDSHPSGSYRGGRPA